MQDDVDIFGKPISDIVIYLPPMETSKCMKSCEANPILMEVRKTDSFLFKHISLLQTISNVSKMLVCNQKSFFLPNRNL